MTRNRAQQEKKGGEGVRGGVEEARNLEEMSQILHFRDGESISKGHFPAVKKKKIILLMCIGGENTCNLVETTVKFPIWKSVFLLTHSAVLPVLQNPLLCRKVAV